MVLITGIMNCFLSPRCMAEGQYQLPEDDQQVVRDNLLESLIRCDLAGAGWV